MKNPVYQTEDIQLEDRQFAPGQRTENYNEIMEPAVKYLFLCIMITSILFPYSLHVNVKMMQFKQQQKQQRFLVI